MLDNALSGFYSLSEDMDILRWREATIQNDVPAIGAKRRLVAAAQFRLEAQPLESSSCASPAKGHDLDRHRCTAPQPADRLALIHHNDQSRRLDFDKLFTEQRTAKSLDKIEGWVDFVGAVKRQIELSNVIQLMYRDANSSGKVRGRERGRDRRHAEALSASEAEETHQMSRGAAGAQSNGHAVEDHLGGMLCHEHLLRISVEHDSASALVGQHLARVQAAVRVECMLDLSHGVQSGSVDGPRQKRFLQKANTVLTGECPIQVERGAK